MGYHWGRAHVGPRRTEAQGPAGPSLCSAKSRVSKAPGLSLSTGRAGWGLGDISAAWVPRLQLLHELVRTENSVPTPTGPGSLRAGEFLPISPFPIKKFHGAASFLLLRKKHFVFSFLSSSRLGVSVSCDCTVLGLGRLAPPPPGNRKWLQTRGSPTQSSRLSLTPARGRPQSRKHYRRPGIS